MITLSVSAIIRRQGRVLMVQRGRDPFAGCWALPGGKVHEGESYTEALVREVGEETGLVVVPERLAGVAEEIDTSRGYHFVIIVSFVAVTGGELRAGDDAADLAWYSARQVGELPLTPRLEEHLTEFGAFGW